MKEINKALVAVLIKDIEEKLKQDDIAIEEVENKLDAMKFRHVDLSKSLGMLKTEFERVTKDD